MYITRKWLEKFVNISSLKDEEITIALNSLGFEVDAYKTYNGLNDNLTLGQVGSVNKIEGTHLNYCFVDLNDDLPTGIICGADNIQEGQFVLVATPGNKIANGLTISNREMHGKVSEGMICALNELGMENSKLTEEEKNNIYVVNTREDIHSHLGSKDILNLIGFNDSIWDFDLTLNRSDALGALQVVKELANYFNLEVKKSLEIKNIKMDYEAETKVDIEIDKSIAKNIQSLSFSTILQKEILTIDETWERSIFSEDDLWLKNSGAKATNNIFTDLANIIALETGQYPIFIDPKKIKKSLKLIDDLNQEDKTGIKLVDGNEIVSLIGIDINQDYLPNKKTKEILVLMLSINPILMRKQQRKYNTSSIAMQRFMKPLSSRLHELAYERIVILLERYDILSHISKLNYIQESDEQDVIINITQAYIDNLLGLKLKSDKIISLFKYLDFDITFKDENYSFKVDKYRRDIEMKADIVEEIARLYGYDNIEPQPLILKTVKKDSKIDKNIQNQIGNFLLGQGFANIKTYSLISKEVNQKWDLFNYGNEIDLAMPLSNLRETYRLSLIPSLIETVIANSKYGNKDVKLYEFADIYNLDGVRNLHLGLNITGKVIDSKAHKVNIRSEWSIAKGYVDSILNRYQINLHLLDFIKMDQEIDEIHPYINAKIVYQNQILGFIFKTNPSFEQKNKIEPSFFVDLNISLIETIYSKEIKFKEISKFQKTSRDITIVCPLSESYSSLLKEIGNDVNYLEAIKLSDIYIDEELKKNQQQAITMTFFFNSLNEQLTDEIVASEFAKIIKKINLKKLVIK